MEIITTGIGEESYKPDQIILTLNFIFKDNLYDEILENGTKSVLDFVNNILYKYGFSENDIKTKSFIIKKLEVMILMDIVITKLLYLNLIMN